MEKVGPFISDAAAEGSKKVPTQRIGEEMVADILLFPKDVQNIIQRGVGAPMTSAELGKYNKAKGEWWQNKYGFPYTMKAARNELIMRKYSIPSELSAAQNLLKDLLNAYRENNEAKIAEIRQTYIQRYPDQLEGIEALFGLRQFLTNQETIELSVAAGGDRQKRMPLYQQNTEYNFVLSDFINANSGDKAFLRQFWAVLEKTASGPEQLKFFHRLQRAIVTQVATGKIFEKIGEKPRLSHPAEDAYKAIDLWTESAAVQITGTTETEAVFLKTDTISFPGVEITRSGVNKQATTYHINSKEFHKAQKFHAKLSEYRKLVNKDVEGYFLVVPYNKIDFITGEPAPELVEFVKKQVATELK